MPDVINVMIAFDAATIVERYGKQASTNPDSPTSIDDGLIYMTTRQDHIIGTSGGELNFRAAPEDIIRWRETTLSLNTDYSALLYRYVSSDPDNELITEPEVLVVKHNYPVPEKGRSGDPAFETQQYKDHFWQATVTDTGSIVYHFSFQILKAGTLVGYFQWDPFITIEDAS